MSRLNKLEQDINTYDVKDELNTIIDGVNENFDFVIDEQIGKTGFQKWFSGKLECWGQVRDSVANSIAAPFAHPFDVELPTVIVSPNYVRGQASSVDFRYISLASYTMAQAYVRDAKTNQVPTSGDASFTYYASGYWINPNLRGGVTHLLRFVNLIAESLGGMIYD